MSKGQRLNEIKKLREMNAALGRQAESLEEKIQQLEESNRQLEEFNRHLYLELHHLRHEIFGRRCERLEDPRQTKLFEEELSEETRKALERSLENDDKDEPKPRSKRNGRRPLPKNLPRKTILLDIPEEDKICPHGHPRLPFDEDVTEELEVIPAKFFVNAITRPKYKTVGCSDPACQGIVMAPLPPRPIDQGRPGPGLLAHVAVSKYGDHLPLYRQAEIFRRHGIDLPRSTLCDWVLAIGCLLMPIVREMKKQLIAESFLQADETPIRVLGIKQGKSHRGYLWAYGVPWGEVVYQFALDRSQVNPLKFLRGFKGHLQIDGYDGYNAVFAEGQVTRLGCLAHARRKFHAARIESPEECRVVLAAIRRLYRLEREMKEEGLGPEAKVQRRRHVARPILEELKILLENYAADALPQSLFGKAITYFLNEWKYLVGYVEVGEAEIDNNSIEHTMRPVGIGRKNYLFCAAPAGGEAAAALYSLVTTCNRLDINPNDYLRDVIERVSTHPAAQIADLTPRGWKQAHHQAAEANGVADPSPLCHAASA